MSDPATLRARRDALSAQRSSGVARVSYDGKTLDYGSDEDRLRSIRTIMDVMLKRTVLLIALSDCGVPAEWRVNSDLPSIVEANALFAHHLDNS